METELKIRAAKVEDAKDLVKIYSYYVENTAVSYEYVTPTVEEFQGRIENTLKKYPYLVAEKEGKMIGYAYAGQFQKRKAYSWNAEMTVYLDRDSRGMGAGPKLYRLLESILKAQGVIKAVALVTRPNTTDPTYHYNSKDFHEKMGYRMTGCLEQSGYKFGRWYDTLLMGKPLNEPQEDMSEIRTFDEVRHLFAL